MLLSELIALIKTVATLPDYEALKPLLERFSVRVQLHLVDLMIDARERVEGLWAKTAPVLEVSYRRCPMCGLGFNPLTAEAA